MMDWLGFRIKQLARLPVNALLGTCVAWEPERELADGYSVALACAASLAPLAVANLRLCAKNQGGRLRELIAVFDCPPQQIPSNFVETAREISRSIDITLLGYDRRQVRVARLFKNGWVFAWMSWCLAIASSKTQALILHDLDAMPIGPMVFEQIYENWLLAKAEFCGINLYSGNGVTEEMGLLKSCGLALDSAYVRRTFRPIDIFNAMAWVDGRMISFDTTLYAQWQSPRRALRPIHESQLVHPSQLICHFTDLLAKRTDLRSVPHSLPMLPYFLYLGDDPTWLATATEDLKHENSQCLHLFDRTARLDAIVPQHWAWMEKQIRRLEQAIFGTTRPEVLDFLIGFMRRAGTSRSVGAELGANAVFEC